MGAVFKILLGTSKNPDWVFRGFLILLSLVFGSIFPVFAQSPAQPAGTMSLEEALSALGGAGAAGFRWDPFFSTGVFSIGENEAAFFSGKTGETGAVLLNHTEVLTLPLPYSEKGNLRFPETFVTQLKKTFGGYVEDDSRFRIAAIIIDPGHGGRDEGTAWSYEVQGKTLRIREKDVVLRVARQLHASLSAAFPNKRLLLTRTGDTTLTLEERVAMANSLSLKENEAAIFVSVHANSSLSNRNARGYEVYYLTPSYRREVIDRSRYTYSNDVLPILNSMLEEEITTESILLANSILKRLDESVKASSPNRGLKAYDWFVVKKAHMPSVLVELGFLSNREEALLMNDDTYLKKLSDALYKGVADFIAVFERSGGMTALQ